MSTIVHSGTSRAVPAGPQTTSKATRKGAYQVGSWAVHVLGPVVKRCSVVGVVVAVGGITFGLCLATLACLIGGLSMRPDPVTIRHFVYHDCFVALVVPLVAIVAVGLLAKVRWFALFGSPEAGRIQERSFSGTPKKAQL